MKFEKKKNKSKWVTFNDNQQQFVEMNSPNQ